MNGKTNHASLDCPGSSCVLCSKAYKPNMCGPTDTHTHTHTEAGGQNKVVTPGEEIRMTKENGTESGEL